MTDIEQLVKGALRTRATDIPDGAAPPLPSNIKRRDVNRFRVAIAGMVVVAAVVLGFSLIDSHFLGLKPSRSNSLVSIDPVAPPLRCGNHKGHDDAPTPTIQQLSAMRVAASTVCQWTNEEPKVLHSTYYKNYQLTNQVTLSQVQASAVVNELASATAGGPECTLIDSAPSRVFSVLLSDEQGTRWKVDVPEPPCSGFTFGNDDPYTSAGLTDLLISAVTESFPLPLSGWRPGDSAEGALLTAKLRLDGRCIVAGPAVHPTAVVWPADFTATIDGIGKVRVLNADRSLVATTGEQFSAGGGSGPTDIAPWRVTCVANYNNVFVIQDSMTAGGQ